MKMVLIGAAAALGLAACTPGSSEGEPQGSKVGAAMPDTSAPRDANAAMTAPDAGATGIVPADGSQPAVAPTPQVGSAGGSPGAVDATPSTPAPAPAQ
ncbi:hypothetical protein [Phenylobacterium sp.]|jgi:hypothetical protein|uniref:hypothetical protein n=1 Tax=Phenylobacterium sp. TaxID=1871053 RepID=UPI002E3551E6|nr:hypothetical protein [Phenylobacterium sp.]HEX2561404.1 hypothetical protein [Phenylobacterium sp.]